MPESLEEYDARTRLCTVKIDADTWRRVKDSYPLKLCKECQAWHPKSTLVDFLCPTCQPTEPEPTAVLLPGEDSTILPCGCSLAREADRYTTITFHHCTPKPPQVPSQRRLALLINRLEPVEVDQADHLARRIIEEWATLNEVQLPEEVPALPLMDEGWLATVIAAFRVKMHDVEKGDSWSSNLLAKEIINQQEQRIAAEAELAKMDSVRHVHDTADLHEQDAYEDTQSLSAPDPHAHDWDKPGAEVKVESKPGGVMMCQCGEIKRLP